MNQKKVYVESSISNVSTLKGVLKTMDQCYRQGIIDAHQMKDVVDLPSFLDKTLDPKIFFLLTNPKQKIEWREWRSKVTYLSEKRHANPLIFFGISSLRHYLSPLLSIAFEYYRCGIEHAMVQFSPRRLADIAAPYKNKYTNAFILWGPDTTERNKIIYAKSAFETKCYSLIDRENQIYGVSHYKPILRLIDMWSQNYYIECRNRLNKSNENRTRKTKK